MFLLKALCKPFCLGPPFTEPDMRCVSPVKACEKSVPIMQNILDKVIQYRVSLMDGTCRLHWHEVGC